MDWPLADLAAGLLLAKRGVAHSRIFETEQESLGLSQHGVGHLMMMMRGRWWWWWWWWW